MAILHPLPRIKRPRIRRKGFQSNCPQSPSGVPTHTRSSHIIRDKRRRVGARIPPYNNQALMLFYPDQRPIAYISRASPIAPTLPAVQPNSRPTTAGPNRYLPPSASFYSPNAPLLRMNNISKANSPTNSHRIVFATSIEQLASQQMRQLAVPDIHQPQVRMQLPSLPSISYRLVL